MNRIFSDRQEAGRLLSERLSGYRDEKPVVLALPRGGVVVACEVARVLGAPLDVVARKLGAPAQPELAIGAIAPGGICVLDEETLSWLGISEDELEEVAARESKEIERRVRLFRSGRPEASVKGKTVILIDDGIATGMTVRAAIGHIRQEDPGHLVLAVPVCAARIAEALRREIDELISLKTPPELWAIGYWYEDFEQVSDGEVVELLERSRAPEVREANNLRGDGGEMAHRRAERRSEEHSVGISAGPVEIEGTLGVPEGAKGVVLFAHGSGSGRHSPRNRHVAMVLRKAGLATLLIDLLTPEEEEEDLRTGHLRFDVGLLAERLSFAADWLSKNPHTQKLRIGYFGASTGAGAALVAAAERPDRVGAVVSRGGRPDLAGEALSRVEAPTLLIVGSKDVPVIGMNEEALQRLHVEKRLEIVPGATHLFEEPGALEEVSRLAADWFVRHLVPSG